MLHTFFVILFLSLFFLFLLFFFFFFLHLIFLAFPLILLFTFSFSLIQLTRALLDTLVIVVSSIFTFLIQLTDFCLLHQFINLYHLDLSNYRSPSYRRPNLYLKIIILTLFLVFKSF